MGRGNLFLSLICPLPSGFTWPFQLASGERSFSQLNLIKTYLRSSIQQERRNSLAIMFVESEINRGLNLDKLKDMANAKARKMSFSEQMQFFVVGYNILKQGCGAGNQASGSNIQKLLAPTSKWFGPLKTENHCLICRIVLLNNIDEVSQNDVSDEQWDMCNNVWEALIYTQKSTGVGRSFLGQRRATFFGLRAEIG